MMFSKFINARIWFIRSFSISDANQFVNKTNILQSKTYFYESSQAVLRVSNATSVQRIKLQFKDKYKRPYSTTKDAESSNAQENTNIDCESITTLFPQTRVALKELSDKTPQKIFEVHYRQVSVSPKGGKKKVVVNNDWLCTYSLVWPEKIKFESTASSKREAAEKAAAQVLSWLYKNNKINEDGDPIYDRDKIGLIKNSLNEPLLASISGESIKRIDSLWQEYDGSTRDIFTETHKTALRRTDLKTMTGFRESSPDNNEVEELSETLQEKSSLIDELLDTKQEIHPVYARRITETSQISILRRQMELKQTMEQYRENISELPIDAYSDQIRATINAHPVSIIIGAAGCGKSTRGPVAILDSDTPVSAIVAEPRKVAAIGICDRVADELGEQIGQTVGCQVRLSSKPPKPPCGSILYCTSGILLRRLQSNPGLSGCTHVFIDEAHERDVNTDMILLLLKRALKINKELKVVIMSATLNVDVLTRYFDNCPVIQVPGRIFPVNVTYLDEIQNKYPNLHMKETKDQCSKNDSRPFIDCKEIVELIKEIDKNEPEGAILVFLPGWADIKYTKSLLDQEFKNSARHLVLPVHSSLSTEDQSKIFVQPLPGIRKIVLSTNIAETSITIPDVVYVVDSGGQKIKQIREGSGTVSLDTVWISLAAAQQRAGRAGRVKQGHCYRLYTREREMAFHEHNVPEILRMPLEQTVLECKSYAPDDKVEDFLSQLPEPPSDKAINHAVYELINLGALTHEEKLTPLGVYLSKFSLHPRLGAYLLHCSLTGTFDYGLKVMTHLCDNFMMFNHAEDNKEEIRSFLRRYSQTSDHSALHRIQNEFEQNLQQLGANGVDAWCDKYKLRKNRLAYVKVLSKLYADELLNSGFITDTETQHLNTFSNVDELGVATLLSGCDSVLVTKPRLKTKGKLAKVKEVITSNGDRAHIGPESVNYDICKSGPQSDLLVYFGGYHSQDRRALVIYKTSVVNALSVLLFCQGSVDILHDNGEENLVSLRLKRHRKLDIKMSKNEAETILKLREMLWSTFKYYYERDTRRYYKDQYEIIADFKFRLVKTVANVLSEGRKECVENRDESVNNMIMSVQ